MTYEARPEKFDPNHLIGAPISREEHIAFQLAATGQGLITSQRHDGTYISEPTNRAQGIWRQAVFWTVERMKALAKELAVPDCAQRVDNSGSNSAAPAPLQAEQDEPVAWAMPDGLERLARVRNGYDDSSLLTVYATGKGDFTVPLYTRAALSAAAPVQQNVPPTIQDCLRAVGVAPVSEEPQLTKRRIEQIGYALRMQAFEDSVYRNGQGSQMTVPEQEEFNRQINFARAIESEIIAARLAAPSVPSGEQESIDTPSQITDTTSARKYVYEWHREHFPTDRTFGRYILADKTRSTHLAGDFAWQLAKALESFDAHVATRVQQARDAAAKVGWDDALNEAALICDQQASEGECPERASYCADEIRALRSPASTEQGNQP